MDQTVEQMVRTRMHGLYLSRRCEDLQQLSHELLGLHCWFHRNVVFSTLIRGADLMGWKSALTKTWLYRGTLHGVVYEDLPELLALHTGSSYLEQHFGKARVEEFAEKALWLMEDGVYSRAEMRRILADEYDARTIDAMLSPWGGVFVHLARQGKVAFRDMTSRDFDMIDAEPIHTMDEVLPGLLERYFTAYGPATTADAAWFFGLSKECKKQVDSMELDGLSRLEYGKHIYYYKEPTAAMGEIPPLTLLSGFDPLIVSYTDRSAVLPPEHKSKVILKSGICNPTIAVNGQVAGIWNIKKREPTVEFFTSQPLRIQKAALDMVDEIRWRTAHL
ncbi:winged helix DNA-binding domain-containing protein [Ruminococcaceae bacterium OttesenSCG-928-L11]|nr:winged helix DNA-binding domain-containing protein [Ruminococcaceae bacterium OttesenSCG-928-L11]